MLSIEMSVDTQRNPQRRCGVEVLGVTRHEGDRSHRSPVHGTDMRGDMLHTSPVHRTDFRGTCYTHPQYTGQTWGGQVSQIPCTRDSVPLWVWADTPVCPALCARSWAAAPCRISWPISVYSAPPLEPLWSCLCVEPVNQSSSIHTAGAVNKSFVYIFR